MTINALSAINPRGMSVHPKTYTPTHKCYSSFILDSQKLYTTQMPFSQRMAK